MGSGVDAHSAGAFRSFDGFHNCEFAGRGFGGDGEGAVAATGEGLAAIDLGRVDAGAERKVGEDLADGAHDDEHLRIAAADEEAVLLGIDGHADGSAAGSDGPAGDDFARGEIDDSDLVLIHEIDVDLAGAVGGEKLGGAAKVDGGFDFAGRG